MKFNSTKLLDPPERIQFKEAVGPLTKSVQWKQVSIHKRKLPEKEDLEAARMVGKELFGKIGPDSPDSLHDFLRENLRKWAKSLASFKPLADTGKYPGTKEIDGCSDRIEKILSIHDPYEFFRAFNDRAEELRHTEGDMRDLTDFYDNLKPAWERLQTALSVFGPNRTVLEKDPNASKSLGRMDQILNASRPYPMLKEVDGLIADVSAVNDVLVSEKRDQASQFVEGQISQVSKRLDESKADAELRNTCLKPLQDIKKQIQKETSIPNIFFHLETAKEHLDNALTRIEEALGDDGKGAIETPVVKVKPAELTTKVYLETNEDVEEYLKRLKETLLEAIKSNSRIRIV